MTVRFTRRCIATGTRTRGWLLLGAALSSIGAQAQVFQQRCNVDSLDPTQAEARLKWARVCAIRNHVAISADGSKATMVLDVPAADGSALYDYVEAPPGGEMDMYSDPGRNGEVNSTVDANLYNAASITQARDASGWWEWSKIATRKKPRPYYPTYGSEADINSTTNAQLYPHPTLADCNLYLDTTGTTKAAHFYNNGYCRSSCYTPEQEVLFEGGSFKILDALSQRRRDLMTLTPASTLDDIELQVGQTASYTAEFRDSEHSIIELKMASGGSLRVTLEHPIVTGEGRLVTAKELKVGDELVKRDGTRDEIVSANRATHYGKVYNLQPVSVDRVSNLLIAQGYVVGSEVFQNDEVNFINRTILFRTIPIELIP